MAASDIEELTDLENLREKFEKNDFNVISWYMNDEYSKLVDSRLEGAKRILDA